MSITSPLHIVGLVMAFHLVQNLDLYFLLFKCFPWEAYFSSSNVCISLFVKLVLNCHAAFLPGGAASTIISQETAQNSGVLLITPLLSSNVHYIQPKETRGCCLFI